MLRRQQPPQVLPTLDTGHLLSDKSLPGESHLLPAMFKTEPFSRLLRNLVYVTLGVALGLAIARYGAEGKIPMPKLVRSASIGQQRIEGVAKILDGDTIDVAGMRIRLEGIDAPESDQMCKTSSGAAWACGTEATKALKGLVGSEPLSCQVKKGRDPYGRVVATCYLGDIDIDAWMVEHGWAWAFVKYSNVYVKEEARAKAQKIGIWQGEAEPAWDYRTNRWKYAAAAAPNGCAIKGKINRQTGERIFHMPWMSGYAQMKVDEGRGERWFCSDKEAADAGWRPSKR